ncbi:MAG: leucine-rich repeat domain-containing protein, partial [Paludibacter sp.]|nr:leucine-rich repeat domain-containing protein [Paludibacter sp.]
AALTTVNIPESITSIGDAAFNGCHSLAGALTIPNSVNSIEMYAFGSCELITSVNIPESLTTINYGTFYHCTGLTSITIPNTVTLIDADAFKDCSGLETVIIGSKVAEMGYGAFLRCTSLKSITSYAVEPPITGESALLYIDADIPVYVPCGSKAAYQKADDWENFTNYHTITVGETTLDTTICYGTTYNDHATSGEYTDYFTTITGCDSIVHLTLTVLPQVFDYEGISYKITSPTTVEVTNNPTASGNIIIPEIAISSCEYAVTAIGDNAFKDCSNLKTITVNAITPPAFGTDAFLNVAATIPVYVPCGSKAAYQGTTGWNYFTNYHTITADTVAVTRYICAGSTYSDNAFTNLSVAGEYQATLTGSAGCDSVITLTLINRATPTAHFPEIVDPCDGGDILVTLTGEQPFDVYYTVSVSGNFPVLPAKLGLGTRFGDGGYPLTQTGDNTYSVIIPSGSAKILTFKVHRVVDSNGCVGRDN